MTFEHLRLRPVQDEDRLALFEHQRDPEACRRAGSPPRGLEAFLEHWLEVASNEAVLRRIIEVEGEPAGYVSSFLRDDDREVGYWLGRAYWGRGVATRALRAFLELETRRPLFARTAKQNAASLRVLEKCGFLRIGEDVFTTRVGESLEEWVLELRKRPRRET